MTSLSVFFNRLNRLFLTYTPILHCQSSTITSPYPFHHVTSSQHRPIFRLAFVTHSTSLNLLVQRTSLYLLWYCSFEYGEQWLVLSSWEKEDEAAAPFTFRNRVIGRVSQYQHSITSLQSYIFVRRPRNRRCFPVYGTSWSYGFFCSERSSVSPCSTICSQFGRSLAFIRWL